GPRADHDARHVARPHPAPGGDEPRHGPHGVDRRPWRRRLCDRRRRAQGHREPGGPRLETTKRRHPRRPTQEAAMSDWILLTHGILLTQDEKLGELPHADILIQDGMIADVGPDLAAPEGARVIDAEGDIVIPGFIDTHRHTWETSIRTSAPDYA